ncbi:MAG TPA: hypothetical protein VIF15_12990 [Polyangiaceae bacterium]
MACAQDVVQPDVGTEASCGDGVVQSGEACDVASPGCVSCQIVPGWLCPGNVCTLICGDGVVGTAGSCDAPRRDTDCDMTGYWAGRATDYTKDAVLGNVQTSSNWYLFHLQQSGTDFQVVEQLDCGVHVTGSATVDYTPGSLRGMMYLNRMDGGGSRPARHGTSQAADGGCAVTLDRWYNMRGGADALLPADFSTHPALASLPPLPTVSDPVTSNDFPAGATDPDGDGIPGIGLHITGVFSGTRNEVQRDWKEYATAAGAPVKAGALSLDVRGTFDLQGSVLRVTDCGTACALIASAAHVDSAIPGRLTFAFIGKTPGSARVAPVVAGVPRQSLDADLTTCANVRLMLPHDPSVPSVPGP